MADLVGPGDGEPVGVVAGGTEDERRVVAVRVEGPDVRQPAGAVRPVDLAGGGPEEGPHAPLRVAAAGPHQPVQRGLLGGDVHVEGEELLAEPQPGLLDDQQFLLAEVLGVVVPAEAADLRAAAAVPARVLQVVAVEIEVDDMVGARVAVQRERPVQRQVVPAAVVIAGAGPRPQQPGGAAAAARAALQPAGVADVVGVRGEGVQFPVPAAVVAAAAAVVVVIAVAAAGGAQQAAVFEQLQPRALDPGAGGGTDQRPHHGAVGRREAAGGGAAGQEGAEHERPAGRGGRTRTAAITIRTAHYDEPGVAVGRDGGRHRPFSFTFAGSLLRTDLTAGNGRTERPRPKMTGRPAGDLPPTCGGAIPAAPFATRAGRTTNRGRSSR